MLTLTSRAKQVLLCLCEERSPVAIGRLAGRLGVSPRALRYDLDLVEAWLKQTGFTLERKPRIGVSLPLGPEELAEVRRRLGHAGEFTHILRPDERQKLIIAALLQRDGPITSSRLARELGVSRNTVLQELALVELWLRARGLRLVRRPNYGVSVVGPEDAWRQAAFDVVSSIADDRELVSFVRLLQRPGKEQGRLDWGAGQVLRLFEGVSIEQVEAALKRTEAALGLGLPNWSFSGLLLHLAIAISRLKRNKDISMPPADLNRLRREKEFRVASALASEIERCFSVMIPEAEIGFITLHLLGARAPGPSPLEQQPLTSANHFDPETISMGSRIIETAERALGLSLATDRELLPGLCTHLRYTLKHLKYGLPIHNPILAEIKSKYPRTFAAALEAAAALGKLTGLRIPEDEAGYIALHIGAALERTRRTMVLRPRALVVCASGIGTASLLTSRLAAECPDLEITSPASIHGIEEALGRHRVDFIVTTLPLDSGPLPIVRVSPLLTEADLGRIRSLINRYTPISEETLLEVARGGASPADVSTSLPHGPGDLFDDFSVTTDLGCSVSSWEEAVTRSGELLVQLGAVVPRYVEAMTRNIKEWGPYCVVAPGLALPHARPEDGVVRSALGVVRLLQPLKFGHPTNDPVSMVVGMAARDERSGKKIIERLLRTFEDSTKVAALYGARTPQDVQVILGPGSARKTTL